MKSDRFLEMLQNVQKFSVPKSETKGTSLWFVHEGHLTAVTTDNYVVYVERQPVDWDESEENYLLDLETLKSKIKSLSKEEEIFEAPNIAYFEVGLTEDELLKTDAGASLLYLYESVVHLRPQERPAEVRFLVHPDRLRKLSLLKLTGDFPLDLQFSLDRDFEPVLGFKAGPLVQGMIAPLEREMQEKEWLW